MPFQLHCYKILHRERLYVALSLTYFLNIHVDKKNPLPLEYINQMILVNGKLAKTTGYNESCELSNYCLRIICILQVWGKYIRKANSITYHNFIYRNLFKFYL